MRLLKKLPCSTQAFVGAALVAAGIGWPGAELEAAEGKAAVIWGSAQWGELDRVDWNGEILGKSVTQVAFGPTHVVALNADGTVTCWGNNQLGQANSPSWVRDAQAVAAGYDYSAALRSDGAVAVWGSPWISPPARSPKIIAIAGGTSHLAVLHEDGTVASWGHLSVRVPQGLANVIQIVSGESHSAALKQDGTVAAWGQWERWDGPPVNAPEGLSNVVQLVSGPSSLFALKQDGSVVAWGPPNGTAHRIPDGLRDVVSLAAGFFYGLAAKRDGSIVIWGASFGSPEAPPSGLTNAVQVAAAENAATVLKSDGSLVSWSRGSFPQPFRPIPLSAKGGGASAVIARGYATVALGAPTLPVITGQPQSQTVQQGQGARFAVEAKGFGLTYQWRRFSSPIPSANDVIYHVDGLQTIASSGVEGNYSVLVQSPDGRGVFSETATLTVEGPVAPGTVVDWGPEGDASRIVPEEIQGRAIAVTTGPAASSAVLHDGSVTAWFPGGGSNNRWLPGPARVTAISNGGGQTLAVMTDGTLSGWNPINNRAWPVPGGAATDAIDVSAFGEWTTLVKANGTVWHWRGGQIFLLPISRVRSAAASQSHTVLLRHDGTVAQWPDASSPIPQPPPLSSVAAVASGQGHSVALKSDGTVVAWGENDAGQCNVPPGLDRVVAIAAGSHHTVALRDDGAVVAWGGHVMDRNHPRRIVPARVPPSLRGVTAIAAGANRTVALLGIPETPLLSVTPTDDGLVATWPIAGAGFALESSRNLDSSWQRVTSSPQQSVLWNHVLIPRTDETVFFRLVQP